MVWKFSALRKRWVYGVGAVIFFVYCAWLLGPYLQSVFVRDASVTSWAREATAPIAGNIVSEIGTYRYRCRRPSRHDPQQYAVRAGQPGRDGAEPGRSGTRSDD